jgi:replicative DNA helicase
MNKSNLSPDTPLGKAYEELAALSIDLELALLGAALVSPPALDAAGPYIASTEFSEPFLGQLWQHMTDMHAQGVKIDFRLVSTRVSHPETIEIIRKSFDRTPSEFIAQLASNATTVVNAPDYAKQIRELYHRRRIFQQSSILQDELRNPASNFREVASTMTAEIEISLNTSEEPRKSINTIITESLGALEETAVAPGVTTGLIDVDRMLGGFVPKDLIVLGARPSMGKSALSISMTVGSALQSYRAMRDGLEGWGLLFMTHEMAREQVAQRMLTDLAYWYGDQMWPVEYERFRPAPGQKVYSLTENQRDGIDKASRLLPRLPIEIDGRPGMTISEVTATIRKHKKAFASRGLKLRVCVADHIGLGKILGVRHTENRVNELGEITSALKAVAVNDDMAVLACHQLSRANEGRENRRPGLADFRDSGHIEQDADIMLGVYRDVYYLERTKETDTGKDIERQNRIAACKNDMELSVLKNRSGKVGLVNLYAHMGANAVRNQQPNGAGE